MSTAVPGVTTLRDDATGLVAAVAVDRLVDGRAAGGIRLRSYPDESSLRDDAVSLARAMTRKCAIAGIRCGGAKTVVWADRLRDRRAALGILGRHVETLGGALYAGPDFGFTDDDRDAMAATTRYVDSPHVSAGLGEATALGVREALAAALGTGSLAGTRIAIQGLGKVGGALARVLRAEGVRVYGHDTLPDRVSEAGAEPIDERRVFEGDWDAVAPCALGGAIDLRRAAVLRCRAVVGGANDLLAPPEEEVARVLAARGIVHVPDVVANAGALIHWATLVLAGGTPGDAGAAVRRIGGTARRILDRARAEHRTPWEVVRAMAEEFSAPARPDFAS
ncbi:MAG: Glu/Leu/Phe/Val dehydrogenase [Planctomycetes bacterium]|nr:Glu/Leu/Phe/Val dehydrogenase [Planctomycetota bacterium]